MPQLQEHIHTIEDWLGAMVGCLGTRHRADGTSYMVLSDADHWADVHEVLTDVMRGAHFGELPNDWRYQTVYDICHGLLEHCQPDQRIWDAGDFGEIAYDLADQLTETGTSQLMQWLADNPSRCEFDDDGLVDGMMPNLARLAAFRQCEEIQRMALFIVDAFSRLLQ